MIIKTLIELFSRDLDALKKEINTYTNSEDMWLIKGEINNSGGNLCLHLCGNLQHFIGAVLGNSGYIREREKEFSDKNISKGKLIEEIDNTKLIVLKTLNQLDINKLAAIYPINVFKREMTVEFFLIHLTTHLSYHLGQINYHRRITLSR